jgi:APA family basic amino acid/polyamine antiporter
VIKILSLAGLIVFGFFAAKAEVWDANWANAWASSSLNVTWIVDTYKRNNIDSAISAALVGSMFSSVAWEG